MIMKTHSNGLTSVADKDQRDRVLSYFDHWYNFKDPLKKEEDPLKLRFLENNFSDSKKPPLYKKRKPQPVKRQSSLSPLTEDVPQVIDADSVFRSDKKLRDKIKEQGLSVNVDFVVKCLH